jgi:hypothetical protein
LATRASIWAWTSAPVIIYGAGSITTTPFMKFLMSCLNAWSRGRNYRCFSNDEYLPPFCNQMNLRPSLHTRHGNFPWTHQVQNIPYARKSCRE